VLPTFVIGLREGVEASLVVGIIAAFLGRHGHREALRWVWTGVAVAAAVCLAIGIGLHAVEQSLPQRQQEGLETIVGLIAIAFVTYMIVWMRRNARSIKGELESNLAGVLAAGSVTALILVAFLAVFREGFETAVFLVAVFSQSDNLGASGTGAVLGLLVAFVIGFLLYKGGLKLDLAKFFKATGVVLVFVVAGLGSSAAHTAHEAGWLETGQTQVMDLSAINRQGTVQHALLNGMLGIQEKPVVAEVVVYLVLLLPLLLFVLWPSRSKGSSSGRDRARRLATATGAALMLFLAAGCGSGSSASKGPTVDITITGEGCNPAQVTVASGTTTFHVKNDGADHISEFEVLDGTKILGEKEGLVPGLTADVAVDLRPGTYTLACPGGTKSPTGTLTVS